MFAAEAKAVEALSRYTGSFDRLGHACLATDPFDPERTAGVLSAALEMGHAERRRRADVIRRTHDLGGPVAFEAAQLAHAVAMTRDAAGR